MSFWGCTEENTRRKYYGSEDDEFGVLMFIPRCPLCGRFVKADESVNINGLGQVSEAANATCAKHDRVTMYFEGFA